ncbi:MAG: peptide/nickel transport system permease protein [Planctomycetota bacterium]|jgi:peptide/nickel transport system permease protein
MADGNSHSNEGQAANPAANPAAARHVEPAPEGAEFGAEYSKDYWDLVFEQLGKRMLFKVSMAVLTLLYGIAVFAPVIANDKPYVIESVDINGYGRALRLLRTTASGAAKLATQTDENYADTRGKVASAPPTRVAAAQVELDASRDRLDVIGFALSEADRPKIEPYREAFEAGLDALMAGNNEVAVERLSAAKDLGKGLRTSLKALDPAKPDAGGVALMGRKAYPLAQSIAPWEAGLMALWILVALWPIWNWIVNRLLLWGNRDRIRAARKFKLFGCLAVVVASSAVWFAQFGNVAEFDAVDYKDELTTGNRVLVQDGKSVADLVADADGAKGHVAWAPVNFGFAELHEPEKFRPPTWTAKAEIDPATGERVFFLKQKLAGEEAGEQATEEAPSAPRAVDIRVGEPELNAPARHPLGTDESGRDILSRMIWGGRVSLSVGILSAALLTIIGVIIGSIAGFFGGWVDVGIMRTIEVLQSIPAFFLILLALAFTDPQTLNPMFAIVIVIAIVRWTGVARLVRGEFMRLREQEFVVAAQALGFSSARTIFRHVLPNAMSPVLVAAAFSVAAGILTESAVSFLGFGIQEPQASWGSIVNESRSADHWWIQMFPGLAIFVTVTCYNLVGDAIRDAMDPKMKV